VQHWGNTRSRNSPTAANPCQRRIVALTCMFTDSQRRRTNPRSHSLCGGRRSGSSADVILRTVTARPSSVRLRRVSTTSSLAEGEWTGVIDLHSRTRAMTSSHPDVAVTDAVPQAPGPFSPGSAEELSGAFVLGQSAESPQDVRGRPTVVDGAKPRFRRSGDVSPNSPTITSCVGGVQARLRVVVNLSDGEAW
jgi:hypothetical protein